MQIKKIEVGKWYETRLGIGKCTRSGGTFPVSCQINIVGPFPRGVCTMPPRDVLREIPDPSPATEEPANATK